MEINEKNIITYWNKRESASNPSSLIRENAKVEKYDNIFFRLESHQFTSIKDIFIENRQTEITHDYIKDFYQNESWDQVMNIQAQIAQVNKLSVICVCLVDKENKAFEYRTFPKDMFTHFHGIGPKFPVIISIKTKAGSSRIDIYNGKGRVDETFFNFEAEWKSLSYTDFTKPLEGPLKL